MIRKQEALKIYIRASIFDDSPLALQALPKAAKVPLAMLCTESLRLLPTLFLMQLVSASSRNLLNSCVVGSCFFDLRLYLLIEVLVSDRAAT